MMMGIVDVARLAASGEGAVPATITSTGSRTSSAARAGSRSLRSPYHRPSMTTFWPST